MCHCILCYLSGSVHFEEDRCYDGPSGSSKKIRKRERSPVRRCSTLDITALEITLGPPIFSFDSGRICSVWITIGVEEGNAQRVRSGSAGRVIYHSSDFTTNLRGESRRKHIQLSALVMNVVNSLSTLNALCRRHVDSSGLVAGRRRRQEDCTSFLSKIREARYDSRRVGWSSRSRAAGLAKIWLELSQGRV